MTPAKMVSPSFLQLSGDRNFLASKSAIAILIFQYGAICGAESLTDGHPCNRLRDRAALDGFRAKVGKLTTSSDRLRRLFRIIRDVLDDDFSRRARTHVLEHDPFVQPELQMDARRIAALPRSLDQPAFR